MNQTHVGTLSICRLCCMFKKNTLEDSVNKSKCGNFMIFLSFRFYVKSILGILDVQMVYFYDFFHLLKSEIFQINRIQSTPKRHKWQSQNFQLISRKISKFPHCKSKRGYLTILREINLCICTSTFMTVQGLKVDFT